MYSLHAILVMVITVAFGTGNGMSLSESEIKLEQVEIPVEYNGRYLHVWKENKQNYSRYLKFYLKNI